MVLEILISGLVALVKDKCEATKATTMHVVMVSGLVEKKLEDDRVTLAEVKHKPRLIVDILDLAPSLFPNVNIPDEIIELPEEGRQLAVWNLEDRQVAFVDPPEIQILEGNRRTIDTDKYLNAYPRDHFWKPDPKNDFSWSPELQRACHLEANTPTDRLVKGDVLKPGELGDFAVARFAPLTVNLKADPDKNFLEAVVDRQSKDDVFEFPKQAHAYRQVLADRARLEMTFTTDPIEIRLHYPASSKNYKTIRLAPRSKDARARISVSNLPNKKWPPLSESEDETVDHFHEYYKLLNYKLHATCPTPTNPGSKLKKVDSFSVHPVKCVICTGCGEP